MQSKATTVAAYLKSLPADRRATVAAVREVILANLDPDYEESMQYGMIGYSVPHRVFPQGYHCDPKQPLPYAGLASQKNHISLYVMTTYGGGEIDAWLRSEWKKTGKKLDMGKCCIRFKRLEDLPLEIVGELIRRVPARAWVAHYQASMDPRTGRPKSSRPSKAKKAAKKAPSTAAKKPAKKKATARKKPTNSR
ncbi:MAG: DUF1801 domain-containing protein [Planctomycetota bacterium]